MRTLHFDVTFLSSLDDLKRSGLLNAHNLQSLIPKAVKAMYDLHTVLDYLHLDLSPTSFRVNEDMSQLKLTDFGCAEKSYNVTASMTIENDYGKLFVAPESRDNGVYSDKSDSYSFAVCMMALADPDSIYTKVQTALELEIHLNVNDGPIYHVLGGEAGRIRSMFVADPALRLSVSEVYATYNVEQMSFYKQNINQLQNQNAGLLQIQKDLCQQTGSDLLHNQTVTKLNNRISSLLEEKTKLLDENSKLQERTHFLETRGINLFDSLRNIFMAELAAIAQILGITRADYRTLTQYELEILYASLTKSDSTTTSTEISTSTATATTGSIANDISNTAAVCYLDLVITLYFTTLHYILNEIY